MNIFAYPDQIHKLEDGDIIKLIPRIVDGQKSIFLGGAIEWSTKVDSLSYKTNTGWNFVHDPDCKWASKIAMKFNCGNPKATVSTKYYLNILTAKGEIKVIAVGRSFIDVINNNKQLLDLKSNWQLLIKIENSAWSHRPVEAGWICPVEDLNSVEQWKSFIVNNQPDLETYFKQNDIWSKRDQLSNYFGSDIIGQIISEKRGEKLNELGI
jgi:hypothetical protein